MIHKHVDILSLKVWLVLVCLISFWFPAAIDLSSNQANHLSYVSLMPGACLAQEGALLKPDIPKIDTNVEQNVPLPAPPAEKKKPALQGAIQKNDQIGNPMFGGANKFFGRGEKGRVGSGASLKGKTNDNTLSGSAESGIGIIGVKFVLFNGKAPVVNRVFPMTPAYKCGVQPFDVIVAVDGVPTFGLTKEEVYDMIVGTPGTPVTISVRREGDYQVYNMVRMDLNDITDPFIRRDYMMSM